jgi:hypothetical protein
MADGILKEAQDILDIASAAADIADDGQEDGESGKDPEPPDLLEKIDDGVGVVGGILGLFD